MAGHEEHYAMEAPKFTDWSPRLLIVVSPYYKDIADNLVQGAQDVIKAAGGQSEVVQVPGALEIPPAIRIASQMGKYDGFVALGCIIRGETTHYDTVCNDSSRGLMHLGVDQGLAIGNGILAVENRHQAEIRADHKGQNKGGGAAIAALCLIDLSTSFKAPKKGIGFKPASEHIVIAGDAKDNKTV